MYCGSNDVVRHGKSAGLTRFRCRTDGCRKTFSATTGTRLAKVHKKDKWETYQQCLRERLTLMQSAEVCGISYRTAFNWRHRFLAELGDSQSPLQGVVEMDETYFLDSAKGDRTLRLRRPPRKRGGNVGRRGLHPDQKPVITAVARGGETLTCASLTTGIVPIRATMSATSHRDAVVVTGAHRSYRAASRQLQRKHEVVNLSQGSRVRDKVWHLNAVNHRHQVMKTIPNLFHRGVSTKYLDHYMNWLCRQEFRPDKYGKPDYLASLTKTCTHLVT